MADLSPSFRESNRNTFSPVPLRSPSPDFITKSAILSTPPAHINHKYKQTNPQKTTLIEEVIFLRDQNARLIQIAAAKGHTNQTSLNDVVKEKDKIIAQLKSQLKEADLKSSKGLSLIGNSGHKKQYSEANRDLKQDNEELKIKVKKLIQENEQLKKKKQNHNEAIPQKHKPIEKDEPLSDQPLSFSMGSQHQEQARLNFEKIKEQMSRELNEAFNNLFSGINIKLQDIQRRVIVIENKVSQKLWKQNSGMKDPISTIGNFSPGFSSSFGNTGNKNSNFNTPQDKRNIALNNKILELEDQLSRVKFSEHNLKLTNVELQQQISGKIDQIRSLEDEIRKNNFNSGNRNNPLSDSKSKKLNQENASMRQSLIKLSGELTNFKNDKINLQRQIENLQRDLENERRLKIPSSIGANQTDQHIIQQLNIQIQSYEIQNKQLVNQNIALKDTLNELRRTASQTVNDLEDQKKQILSLKSKIDNLERQNSELVSNRPRADSNADLQTHTEIMKLRLRINELERCSGQNEFINNQLKSSNNQLNQAHSQIRELKGRQFDLQNENNNLRKEAQRAYSLGEENQMLKRTIASHERSQQQLLKGSDHTKNQLIKTNQEKVSLQNEIIQLKSNLRMTQNDLVTVRQRLGNFQKQYRKIQQQLNIGTQKYNQIQFNLNSVLQDKDQLTHENQFLNNRIKSLEADLQKLMADNQKENLLNQINILTTKLRDSEHHLTNSKKLEQQKNNELKSALTELGQVKRLLAQMNFGSVEAVIRELQSKERKLFQERRQTMRVSQQNVQQIRKLSFDNDKLKKQALEWSQKFIEQKQKADKLSFSITHLQNQKNSLNDKIQRLDNVIKQYINQQTPGQNIISSGYNSSEIVYVDERMVQRQLQEINYLKQPINRAVQKLDRVAEKISRKIGQSNGKQDNLGIGQTHSYMIPTSTIGDSTHQ